MKKQIKEAANKQFAETASAYSNSAIHAKGADLGLILELLSDIKDKKALDIATGAGHTAITLAKAGAEVVATDITVEMLEQTQINAKKESLSNVTCKLADAEDLRFADNSFDIVTCRIAAHHFANPNKFVAEVARVLKKNGSFILIDNISPSNSKLAKAMNKIEKLRDPSHVEAYNVETWFKWIIGARLELFYLNRFKRNKLYSTWLNRAKTSKENTKFLEDYIQLLGREEKEYFDIVYKDDKIKSLSHEVILLLAKKTS